MCVGVVQMRYMSVVLVYEMVSHKKRKTYAYLQIEGVLVIQYSLVGLFLSARSHMSLLCMGAYISIVGLLHSWISVRHKT